MRLGGRLGWTIALAVIALVALLAPPKLATSRALAIWLVIVAALVLVALIRESRERAGPIPPSRFEQALRRRKPATAQPEELVRMEREILLGIADADHAHRQLLPLLRATASARIAARHGLEPGRRPELERELLGEEVWQLLRPDRPEPADRHGPGLRQEQVVAVIEKVESL
ncbi:MAG TPA: hypothetical protein VJV76_05355 [Gaiellaceae bacterium]|nr:hypothetical protein [Gaiellaceae bacterium]